MKKLLAFLTPMFIVLMYIKIFYQGYIKVDFSYDGIITILIVNFIVFGLCAFTFISDIYNISKGKKFLFEKWDEEDFEDDEEIDIELLLKGFKWYYTYSSNSKGIESSIYMVEDFNTSEKNLFEIKKNYSISYENNLTILKYKK